MDGQYQNYDIAPVSGEFVDCSREHQYRNGQADTEIRQIRLIWVVALGCFALYAPVYYILFDHQPSWRPLLLRAVILGVGTLAVLSTATTFGRRHRDLVCFVALAMVSLCYALLLGERSQPHVSPGALLLLVVGIYLFSPGRFWLVCANGLFCGALSTLLAVRADPVAAVHWLDYSYLLPANLLAAMVLAQMNRIRRRLHKQSERLCAEVDARRRAQSELASLHRRNLGLLHNALPAAIASQLSRNPDHNPVSHHPMATVLFADMVGFTALASRISAHSLVQLLNTLFSRFDDLAEEHGLEKIKTVGDAYMAAAGVTDAVSGQQGRAAAMALAQLQACDDISRELGLQLKLRIGIHCGPVIAGVVGRKRYAFDIWGETVNVASRLEAAAAPGRILVSQTIREACPPDLLFGPSRRLVLRGCGPVYASTLYSRISLSQGGP